VPPGADALPLPAATDLQYGLFARVLCLGLKHIYQMVTHRRQHLRVELGGWKGEKAWAEFDNFRIAGRKHNYKLISIGTVTGNAGRYDIDMRMLIESWFCQ